MTIALIVISILVGLIASLNTYLTYKVLIFLYDLSPEEAKSRILRLNNKFSNETVVMDWEPKETDEEIAFKESMKKLEEMRKNPNSEYFDY